MANPREFTDALGKNSNATELPPANSPARFVFVRVQDELHGATFDAAGLRLPYSRKGENAEARNTSHWSVNSIVSDHAYGSFNEASDGALKGKVVIIALPDEMPTPAGLGQVDTWFRMDAIRGADGSLQRGISVGRNAVVVAPLGLDVPDGVAVVRYEGDIVARDAAVNGVIHAKGVDVEQAGMWGWVGRGQSLSWAQHVAHTYYGDRSGSIHCGSHLESADESIENGVRVAKLVAAFESERLYTRSDGLELPTADVIRDEISRNREILDQTIQSMQPAERDRVGAFYEERVSALDGLAERTNTIERSWAASLPPPLPNTVTLPLSPPPLPAAEIQSPTILPPTHSIAEIISQEHSKSSVDPQEFMAQGPVDASKDSALAYARNAGFESQSPNLRYGRYAGPLIHETEHHVIQNVGKKTAVLHEKSRFDGGNLHASANPSESVRVQYRGGRAALDAGRPLQPDQGRSR